MNSHTSLPRNPSAESCAFDSVEAFEREQRIVNMTKFVFSVVSDPSYSEPHDSEPRLHYVVIPRLYVAAPHLLPPDYRLAWYDEIERLSRQIADPHYGAAVFYKLKPGAATTASIGVTQPDHIHAHVVGRMASDNQHNIMGAPLTYESFAPMSAETIDLAKQAARK